MPLDMQQCTGEPHDKGFPSLNCGSLFCAVKPQWCSGSCPPGLEGVLDMI